MKKTIIIIVLIVLSLSACKNEVESTVTVPSEQKFQFSSPSGIYPEAFELTITAENSEKILYTLDGSNPAESQSALVYSAPIQVTDRRGQPNVVSAVDPLQIAGSNNKPNAAKYGFTSNIKAPSDDAVDKCTVIRAVMAYDDGTYSQEINGCYFIGTAQEHIEGIAECCAASGQSLAVISISMNYNDLFDSKTGIYVKGDIFNQALDAYLRENGKIQDGETARSLDANYKQRGREWERQAAITMFEFSPDGAIPVLTQNCGIRVQGNYSRSDLQKGLRLYARSEYGDNNFRYAVFGEEYWNDAGEIMDKFKTLVLRAGGNCAFTAKFNDIYWQTLCESLECETKKSRPCVVYLNGEYWGLYVLEEDYSDDYFEDLHGVNKEDVIVYKGDAEKYDIGYKLDVGDIPQGENVDFYFTDLLEFFATHENLKSQQDYDAFAKLVDPQSVMDYFAVQSWINNKWDWPGKNWSMWKTINTDPDNSYADGRWRFIFYDMEFGGVSGKSDAKTNTIREDNYKPLGLLDTDTGNPAVLCFAYLMTNDSFRQQFCEKLLGLSNGIFEKELALSKLQEFEDIYSPLYDQFFDRYPGTGSSDNAVNGGYASIRCIRDFLNNREKYIQKMVDYCNSVLS